VSTCGGIWLVSTGPPYRRLEHGLREHGPSGGSDGVIADIEVGHARMMAARNKMIDSSLADRQGYQHLAARISSALKTLAFAEVEDAAPGTLSPPPSTGLL
jgi:hypothetical protein